MDSRGSFTDLVGALAATDPLTGLPLDGNGDPMRPARLTIPEGGTVDYRFTFALPVEHDSLTFHFVMRLYLFVKSDLNLINDLREVLTLRHKLEQRNDYLLSLNDTTSKQPYAFVLVYRDNVLSGGRGPTEDDAHRLGERVGVLITFVTET